MTKQQTLDGLISAKDFHEKAMKKIGILVTGKCMEEITTVSKKECSFGKWIYSHEKHLIDILGALFYTDVERIHARWHEEYYKIHLIYFREKKTGFLAKLSKANEITTLDIEKAKMYYKELIVITAELLRVMTSCERRINALQDSKFD